MGEMITKPDANPIVFALLNLVGGCVGYFMMGQSGKGVAALVYVLIAYIVLGWLGIGFLLGFALIIMFVYDAYQLGQKLQSGESIGQKENAVGLLNSLPGFK